MPIVDLRDYRAARAARDALIERCESLLFPEQRRLGARFPGLFRDKGDPDRFVWLREMPDLAARKRILTAFYTDGELWRAQRSEVNRWIRDSDDVLLLRPLEEDLPAPSAPPTEIAMLQHLRGAPLDPDDTDALDLRVRDAVARVGGAVRLAYATDPAENNYPRHPIRTGEHGLVWFVSVPTAESLGIPTVTERRLAPTTTSLVR